MWAELVRLNNVELVGRNPACRRRSAQYQLIRFYDFAIFVLVLGLEPQNRLDIFAVLLKKSFFVLRFLLTSQIVDQGKEQKFFCPHIECKANDHSGSSCGQPGGQETSRKQNGVKIGILDAVRGLRKSSPKLLKHFGHTLAWGDNQASPVDMNMEVFVLSTNAY